MLNKQNQGFIRQYILDNRNTYTRLTIEENLRGAGYSQTDIDTVYAKLHGKIEKLSGWRAATWEPLGCLLFFPLVPLITYVVMMTFPMYFAFIFILAFIVVIVMRIILPKEIEKNNPGVAKGMVYGFRILVVVFLVLPILSLALFSICLTLIE